MHKIKRAAGQLSALFVSAQSRSRHRALQKSLVTTTAITALMMLSPSAFAGPNNGTVVEGSAGISQAGSVTNINQSSNKAIINWQGFSVGANETVNFNQPGASSVTLNRVIGNETSVINGALNANGQVFIVNSAGVLFGKGSQVNVGGLVASTLDISNNDFMAGKYTFSGTSSASVVNQGHIRAGAGGYVALLGKTVSNDGAINATLGTVAMASGNKITLNFGGNSLVDVTIDEGTLNALVENKRAIRANGGQVIMTAKAADQVLSAQVNNSGVIQARTMGALTGGSAKQGTVRLGKIKLLAQGGTTTVSGKLDASAPKGGSGGTIIATGTNVNLTSTARIEANGDTGGTILVGGDRHGGSNANENFAGEIVANATTTTIAAGAKLAANGTNGDGGHVVVWSNDRTDYAGTIAATGTGAGNGGFAEVSSHGVLGFTGTADLRSTHGATGTLLLDPYDVVISNGADKNGGFDGQTPTNTYTPTGTSVIDVATLENALSTANVKVTTNGAGTDAGNITVNTAVSWLADTVLTLEATNNINVNAAITAGGANAGLTLSAGHDININNAIRFDGANALLTMNYGGDYNILTKASYSGVVLDASGKPVAQQDTSGGIYGSITFTNNTNEDGLKINGQDYTLIHSMADLATLINAHPGDHYALADNLDAASWSSSNTGAASAVTTLSGTLAGMGHTISHLTINAPAADNVGLIGQATAGSLIRDIGIVDANITGHQYVGALVGSNGVLGVFDGGTIRNAYSTATLMSIGDAGGLVGKSYNGSISDSYSVADITVVPGSGANFLGGLAGEVVGGSIVRSNASGAITMTDTRFAAGSVGGLVGLLDGAVLGDSYATTQISAGPNSSFIGGLVGQITYRAPEPLSDYLINNVFATGNVSGSSAVGGLVGELTVSGATATTPLHVTLDNAYATGDVTVAGTGGGSEGSGGLIGVASMSTHPADWSNLTIKNVFAQGAVTDTRPGGSDTGGLIGSASYLTLSNANATGAVTGSTTGSQTGGLIGLASSVTMTNSHATGNVSGNNAVGGLVGDTGANQVGATIYGNSIDGSSATGNVTGTGSNVGGLVGSNELNSSITNSNASGNVTGPSVVPNPFNPGGTGGLVGYNSGSIANSYATGVVAGAPGFTGGIAGINQGSFDPSDTTNGVIRDSFYNAADNPNLALTNNRDGFPPGATFGGGGLNRDQIADAQFYANGTIDQVLADRAAAAAQAAAEAAAAAAQAAAEAAATAAFQSQAARIGSTVASTAANTASTQTDTSSSTAGTQAASNPSTKALDANTKAVEDDVKADDARQQREHERRRVASRSNSQRRHGGGGYGATIRSIDVDGQRFNLQNNNSNKGAPGDGAH